jgi:amino acid adenylation domain-containing protein
VSRRIDRGGPRRRFDSLCALNLTAEVAYGLLRPRGARRMNIALGQSYAHRAAGEWTELTERQLLVWLEREASRDVPSSNMVATFRIRADVDVPRFERAFRTVVDESDALRTVFDLIDGGARQRVLAEMPATVARVDLSHEPDPQLAFRRWSDERRQRPLPLSERAFDCALVRLGDGDEVWYLCLHHLITDAWSFALVYERTLRTYAGEVLPALPPFLEHVEKALAHRGSEEHARSEAFWRTRLATSPPPVRFYGATTPPRQPYFERHTLVLDEQRTEALAAFAACLGSRPGRVQGQRDATMAMLLTSLVLAYVHRVSGNRRIGIGCPFVNRPTKRDRETIGAFLEVCPLDVELEEGETFRTLLGKAKKDLVTILPHARHTVSNPVSRRAFEVMVNFHTARFRPWLGATQTELSTGTTGLHPESPRAAEHLASAEGESLVVSAADFDDSGRTTLAFDFRLDAFDELTRRRAPEHFLRLLDGFIEDPDRAIDRVPLVGDEERAEILARAQRSFGVGEDRTTLIHRFDSQVSASASRPAVRHGEAELDYQALGARVDRLAERLVRRGIAPEDRIALRVPRSVDMLVAMLGILKAGGAYVPLDPAYPAARALQILDDAKPALLLTSRTLTAPLARPELETLFVEDDAQHDVERVALPVLRPEQLAYVIFTSGSTGRPKGVEITHGALANFLRSMAREPGLRAGERVVALTTIAFDIAALELFLPLTVGASVEIVDRETATDGLTLAAWLTARPGSLVQATPATWRMLLESGFRGSAGLRALVGGEALAPDLARALTGVASEVWNMYGPTETTVWSTIHRVTAATVAGAGAVPIGRAIDNTSAYVLDEERALLPFGVLGELYIGGDGVARGYHGRPDLTDERFLSDPFSEREGARIYRTGDLASLSHDGVLRYAGRADRQIKLRGFRIEPAEIESVLRLHANVRDAVVAVREVRGDARLVAYVVARGDAPSGGELRALVSERLPEHMVPAHFVALSELPRTPNGKLDASALPDPTDAIDEATSVGSGNEPSFDPPATDRELQLATIWQELLGVPRVARRDDFFALGGHSLLAVRLASRLSRELGVELSIRTLFEHPTLEGLASSLGAPNAIGPTLVPLQRDGTATPLFFVCGLNLYQPLAERLGKRQPSFGVFVAAEEKVAAEATSEGDAPEVSLTALGSDYVDVIRAHQPHGPYRLAGVSFGGVLAFEVAQRLRAMGEEVELLALLDSILPRGWTRSPIRSALDRARSLVLGKRAAAAAQDEGPAIDRALLDRRESIYLRAIEAYDPQIQSYPGSALLFRALDRANGAGVTIDPWCGWRNVIEGGIETVDVPGDHLEMLREPWVDVVASALRERLEKLDGR